MGRSVRERNKAVIASLTLQPTSDADGKKMDAIRKAAQAFAKVVVKNTEDGPEATLAQRHVEQAVFYGIRSVLFDRPEEAPAPEVVPVKRGTGRPRKVVAPVQKTVAKRRGRPPKNPVVTDD